MIRRSSWYFVIFMVVVAQSGVFQSTGGWRYPDFSEIGCGEEVEVISVYLFVLGMYFVVIVYSIPTGSSNSGGGGTARVFALRHRHQCYVMNSIISLSDLPISLLAFSYFKSRCHSSLFRHLYRKRRLHFRLKGWDRFSLPPQPEFFPHASQRSPSSFAFQQGGSPHSNWQHPIPCYYQSSSFHCSYTVSPCPLNTISSFPSFCGWPSRFT